MPAYRAEGTLEKTVADIPPGLADELILVDDASPDNTVQLAHELGVRVYPADIKDRQARYRNGRKKLDRRRIALALIAERGARRRQRQNPEQRRGREHRGQSSAGKVGRKS